MWTSGSQHQGFSAVQPLGLSKSLVVILGKDKLEDMDVYLSLSATSSRVQIFQRATTVFLLKALILSVVSISSSLTLY